MNLENNWQHKTLENLEKQYWGEPEYDSFLVTRMHELRKIPLKDFRNEDIAMLIRQESSLEYVIPLAINALRKDILAEDNGGPGGLMNVVLQIDHRFWLKHSNYWKEIDKILNENLPELGFDRNTFNKGNESSP